MLFRQAWYRGNFFYANERLHMEFFTCLEDDRLLGCSNLKKQKDKLGKQV